MDELSVKKHSDVEVNGSFTALTSAKRFKMATTHYKEAEGKLGPSFVEKLLQGVKSSSIDGQKMKDIAQGIHSDVLGSHLKRPMKRKRERRISEDSDSCEKTNPHR